MISGKHRPTVLTVDQRAIRHNINHEVKRLDDHSELWMVVKANGYGHGATQVARAALEAGATGFCVAVLDEALELRDAGFTQPILVLGITTPEYAPLMAQRNISATVGSTEWLTAAMTYLQTAQLGRLNVHFGLDTGMGRIGFQTPAELRTAVDYLDEHEQQFNFEGIFTHFATADDPDDTYFKTQYQRWEGFMAQLSHRPRYVHVSNSATSLWHAACNGNLIRFGVAGYGLNPSGGAIQPPYELEPAMGLVSQLTFSKYVEAGRSIGYGATYTTSQPEWIGTVPIGYADGYERRLQGFDVLVDGQRCEIVGRICMDQLMIRLPKAYEPGTPVTLIGSDGNQTITMQDVATYCETIHYEIACGFTARVPRVYQN
ncbi:alanine racemase [Levilactobacillus bambusae]|uniref:Alanine racemase n=1 Tax=Levilactobacillus bambusae TaxID=2024736 RepID=A0A2V1MW39_9LACO|nr:alanine racemase [Levilactobacillus bambusae]PWF99306.1 alanine racemase [Levilactobacillus bambusae]